jgi:hypothetical protein
MNRAANEDLLSLCRSSTLENTLIIDHMDSTNGFSKIKYSLSHDTLKVRIFVSYRKKQKPYEIKYDNNIKFISTGKKTYEIDKIKICENVGSGERVLEDLRNLK